MALLSTSRPPSTICYVCCRSTPDACSRIDSCCARRVAPHTSQTFHSCGCIWWLFGRSSPCLPVSQATSPPSLESGIACSTSVTGGKRAWRASNGASRATSVTCRFQAHRRERYADGEEGRVTENVAVGNQNQLRRAVGPWGSYTWGYAD